ncbi:hypothetical protein C4O30_00310 [Lactiplantibacillus plantarum]|uniref:phage head-tail connector protein n=1 Tax=Lactiplantibacillus plantarum TaxID=1590 RepID=UPI000CE997F8|nr:phage head-tail connector protein [Lactiplantibacillus plantarum]AVE81524.1 hypothetical protein C4O30_00310 [Lactiplantibacillus plantarum]
MNDEERTERIKSLLHGIKLMRDLKDADNVLDDKLELYIGDALDAIGIYINQAEVPQQLDGVVRKMAASKFVQEGAEGATATSEEGLSFTFSDDDMKPFATLLNKYVDNQSGANRLGSVVTWD